MTTLLVINDGASRAMDTDLELIKSALKPLGSIVVGKLSKTTSLADLLQDQCQSIERVVVGGGDGTLNRCLPTIIERKLALGVLPLGTANDFARSLSIPADPVAAATVIAAGHLTRVDVGEVNGHLFLNALGVGLGPTLTQHLASDAKRRLGVVAYLESLIQVLGQRKRMRADIRVDGKLHHHRFMQITVGNGKHYGGGMVLADVVALDDSLLHALCVEPLSPMELLGRALKLRWGKVYDDEKLSYYSGNEIQINTAYERDVTADGELLTKTPLTCKCLPQALEVFVPAN